MKFILCRVLFCVLTNAYSHVTITTMKIKNSPITFENSVMPFCNQSLSLYPLQSQIYFPFLQACLFQNVIWNNIYVAF